MENSLHRFIDAQNMCGLYVTALQEMKNGQKRSHWIWFIFPQLKGFGYSRNSLYFGLDGIDEDQAYLFRPIGHFA